MAFFVLHRKRCFVYCTKSNTSQAAKRGTGMDKTQMVGALNGIRVMAFTHVLAGPFAAYQLALLGADVIKIEDPNQPDCARGRGPALSLNATGMGLTFQVQGANQRALALDLRDPRGAAVARSLAQGHDVLIENFRTGRLAGLGLGYDALSAGNPGLVYCSMTGYGDTGPKAETAAYDNVIQAASGTIAQSGGIKPGLSFVDYATGYAAAFAISAALIQRFRTGAGTHISLSMLEVAMTMMAPEAVAALTGGQGKAKEPGLQAYETEDGILMLGAFQPHQYRRLGECLNAHGWNVPELAGIRDWPDIRAVASRLSTALKAVFASATAMYWSERLQEWGLPAEKIVPLSDAVRAPQLQARGFFATPPGGMAPVPLSPFSLRDGGAALTRPAPQMGEHSQEILAEIGLSGEDIAILKRDGVVR